MFRFFRQIRQHLLSDNKFSKYLLYAIGEVILVMIGILLALQVNNWNETKRTRRLERSTLIEISNALQADHVQLESWISIKQLQDSNITRILDYLQDKAPYTEELDNSWQSGFLRPVYSFNTSPYELLKSRGFEIIENDSLRKDLQYHYDISIPNMIDYLDRNYELMSSFRSEYLSHFHKKPKGLLGRFAPSNMEALRSEEILNGLSVLGFWHEHSQEWLGNLKKETEKLNAGILEYLKTR
ncbi:DUF6090 family protein [Robiginitalea sp. SC105]|uniref:DUF6090 family protein n=1 Tax=Robiginitalea sp. SC105 TaxID=2762332 RepID=UPI00163A41E1|nr:DUF6090 family protein [Robiginitalea sp. SC105]MBC2838871.1 hypothetical protein [Robiginitalea sp. SC105]